MSERPGRRCGRRGRFGDGARGGRRPRRGGTVAVPARRRPDRHPAPAGPPARTAGSVNYRPCPGPVRPRLDPLTPVERVGAWAVVCALALYGVACFLPPVAGADLPIRPAVRQLLYGRGGGWCWVGNPLLLAACLYLLSGRHRAALLVAVAATAAGLAAHLRCAGWRAEALGSGYLVWQTAVLVVGSGAALGWQLLGAAIAGKPRDS